MADHESLKMAECPVADCHDRVDRIDKRIDGKVSWRILVITVTILTGTFGIFLENKVESIELNSKAIAVLEERSRSIKETVKSGVREVFEELKNERGSLGE